MNYRLPNPSSAKYRANWEMIFHVCPVCKVQMELTPWYYAQDADHQARHVVCRPCKTIYIERKPPPKEEAPATK